MYDEGDLLLYTLSAWGRTSWRAFKSVFDGLFSGRAPDRATPSEIPFVRARTVRSLSALGHFDTSGYGSQRTIAIGPTVLASLPVPGLPRAVLCGSRSPGTLTELRDAARDVGAHVDLKAQPSREFRDPARVVIEAETTESLKRLAEHLGVAYEATPVAWSLAKLAGSIQDYLQALSWKMEPELNWRREDFSATRVSFGAPQPSNGIRLSRYQDPVRLTWKYKLWRGEESAEVEADWGRYASLASEGKRVLSYDKSAGIVRVPLGAPLPLVIARSLVLCSGYSSRFETRVSEEVFTGVPVDVFSTLGTKLNQHAATPRS